MFLLWTGGRMGMSEGQCKPRGEQRVFPNQQPGALTWTMKLEHLCCGQSQADPRAKPLGSITGTPEPEPVALAAVRTNCCLGRCSGKSQASAGKGFSPALARDCAGVEELWDQSQAKLLCFLAVKGFA